MPYLDDAIAELKDLIVATWPEVLTEDDGRKLWEAEHAAAWPFEEILKFELPYAVLQVKANPAVVAQDGEEDFLDCDIFYVADEDEPPRGVLETLRDTLNTDPLSLSQVWPEPRPRVTWDLDLEANRLLRGKKLPLLAGRVSVRLLAGEGA